MEVPVTWQMRMNEIQGALLGAAVFHVLVGYTGLLGILLRFVGPLVVCVVITTLSIPLIHIGTMLSGFSWPFAIITFILAVVMGQYCSQLKFPIPFFSIKKKQCTFSWYPIFQTYPIILALLISWFLCYVLTTVGVLDGTDSWKLAARTDTKAEALENSAWLRVPYPFQWGMPTFSATSTIGMITGVLASTLESIGDYYACARLSGAPRPPVSAVNRGIGTEGIGNILCGMWGCGIGTTSYSDNIGIIAITKVGNRRVVQMAACWMILFGVLSKLGALFAAVPIPIIGGITLFIVGFVVSAGLSELQFVNMKRSRNMFVLGASLTLGIGVPVWIDGHPGVINTGSMTGDQILLVLLKSNMLVGGLLALILDNTLPDPDRVITAEESPSDKEEDTGDIYDFPCGMQFLRKIRCFRWTPCCPTFKGYRVPGYKKCKTAAAS